MKNKQRSNDAFLRQIDLWLLYLNGEYPCRPAPISDFIPRVDSSR